MPVLTNARHEAFAQAIVKGAPASVAYKASGYGASGNSAEAAASRLLSDVKVAKRIAELQSKAARKATVTIETIAAELEEARVLAIAEKQTSAAVSASMGKAKLFGLIVDKHKHSGSIGTYDLTKLSDDELGSLEAILGPLADTAGDPSGAEEA
ncbi:terminase small subunit [Bosea sp. 2KB_26]|uniref:terminase small subunit n=1 Tax=Bosea sp. 2KB_26 TaxID=3237475 RepID=UPI003F8E3481